MDETNRMTARGETRCTTERGWSGPDPLHDYLRRMVRHLVERLLEAELDEALGGRRYARCAAGRRRGYRHAARERTVTTGSGATVITVPRARLFEAQGAGTQEWHAHVLRGAPLSNSAVSRVMRTLRERFEAWRTRPLDGEPIAYLFLDGIAVKVRVDRRVQSVPVLVALGVTPTGEKRLLAVRLMGNESKAAWGALVDDVTSRGLRAPVLVVMDGNAGLRHAVGQAWPQAAVQRCVVHTLRNLEAPAPKRVVDEMRATFHAITEAESERAVSRKAATSC